MTGSSDEGRRATIRPMVPLTFAHRGGLDGGSPENSLGAFSDALARGCDLETDLRLSSDGQVMLVHDAVTWARGPAWVALMPARVLRWLGLSTLEDLYRELGSDFHLSADLKVLAAVRPALEVARSAGAVSRLWLVSEQRPALAAIRREDPTVRLVHETRHAYLAVRGLSPPDHLARLAADGVNAANTTVRDWSTSLVECAHHLGLAAFGSLLQDQPAMERAVELGLDGFYSDHLSTMRAVVAGLAS